MDTTRTLSMLFKPAGDMPGAWVAHVLDFHSYTYGLSLPQAIQSALEVAAVVVQEDFTIGRDPTDRRAPEADWQELRGIIQHGELASDFDQAAHAAAVVLIVPCTFPMADGGPPRQPKPRMAAPLVQSFQAAA